MLKKKSKDKKNQHYRLNAAFSEDAAAAVLVPRGPLPFIKGMAVG